MNLNDPVNETWERPRARLLQDFPQIIDNTARETWTICEQKFHRQCVNRLARSAKSPDLHFGGAFALGLEIFRRCAFDEKLSDEQALSRAITEATRFYGDYIPPEGHKKNYESLLYALSCYARRYPTAYDHIRPHLFGENHAIEFTFAVPLPIKHPQTGDPLIYAGRFDMLAEYNGQLFVFDDKTTSQLGPSWARQWATSSQLTGYCWAAKQYGLDVSGAIIRGQSILQKSCDFAEVIQYRSPMRIALWYGQLLREIRAMIKAWETAQYDYAFNASCNSYNGCPFSEVCLSNNPEAIIESNYVNHIWNPLDKEPLKEAENG